MSAEPQQSTMTVVVEDKETGRPLVVGGRRAVTVEVTSSNPPKVADVVYTATEALRRLTLPDVVVDAEVVDERSDFSAWRLSEAALAWRDVKEALRALEPVGDESPARARAALRNAVARLDPDAVPF